MSAHGAIFEAPAAHGPGLAGAAEVWGESVPFLGATGRLQPMARSLAPLAAQAVAGVIPGGSMLGGLLGPLLGQAEKELVPLEAAVARHAGSEGSLAAWGSEAVPAEVAHELAMTELLGTQAGRASSDAEAATILAGALPITITVMGGQRALRPVVPVLAQATSRLVGVLRRQGPQGRELLRAGPAIQRRTVTLLRLAARRGRPVTGQLATKAMARAASGVLSDPRLLRTVLDRNRALPARPTCRCASGRKG